MWRDFGEDVVRADIAKRLLQYERQNISATGFGADRNSGPTLADIAKKYVGTKDGVIADGDLRSRVTKSMMYEQAFMLTIQRNTELAKAGAPARGVGDGGITDEDDVRGGAPQAGTKQRQQKRKT